MFTNSTLKTTFVSSVISQCTLWLKVVRLCVNTLQVRIRLVPFLTTEGTEEARRTQRFANLNVYKFHTENYLRVLCDFSVYFVVKSSPVMREHVAGKDTASPVFNHGGHRGGTKNTEVCEPECLQIPH